MNCSEERRAGREREREISNANETIKLCLKIINHVYKWIWSKNRKTIHVCRHETWHICVLCVRKRPDSEIIVEPFVVSVVQSDPNDVNSEMMTVIRHIFLEGRSQFAFIRFILSLSFWLRVCLFSTSLLFSSSVSQPFRWLSKMTQKCSRNAFLTWFEFQRVCMFSV